MCQNDDIPVNNLGNNSIVIFECWTNFCLDKFRNGVETASQPYTGTKQTDVNTNRRLHEPWDHYNRCITRERNKGLLKISC